MENTSVRSDDSRRIQAALEATKLGFGVTKEQVVELARTAVDHQIAGVCVPLRHVSIVRGRLNEHATGVRTVPRLVTVVNFPFGDQPGNSAIEEASFAARFGADEIDIVIPGLWIREQQWSTIRHFLHSCISASSQEAGHPIPFKVILETAALSRDEIIRAAEASIGAGARWLKTSTGFHPAGGASIEAVALLREIAPAGVGVKASGGIRTREQAIAMLDAGADRLGASAVSALLDEKSVAMASGESTSY